MSGPKRQKHRARAATTAKPDLSDILGQFSDAMAFAECAARSMEANEGGAGPELHVIEHALATFRLVYNALDRATSAHPRRN